MLASTLTAFALATVAFGSPIIATRTVDTGNCSPNISVVPHTIRSASNNDAAWRFKFGGQPGQVSEAIEIENPVTNTSDPAVQWYLQIPSAMTHSYIISSNYYPRNSICVSSPNVTSIPAPLTNLDCATEYGKVAYGAYFNVFCDECAADGASGGVCTLYNLDLDACATYPSLENGLVTLSNCTGEDDQKWLISPA